MTAAARLSLVSLSLLAGIAPGQEAGVDTIETIDGKARSGRLEGAGTDSILRFRSTADGVPEHLALETVYRVTLGGSDAVTDPQPIRLWLRSGLAPRARFEKATESGAAYSLSLSLSTQLVEFPWRHVRAVVFSTQGKHLDEGFAARLDQPAADKDTLYALGEEGVLRRLSLEVLRFEVDHIAVRFAGAERTMPLSRVYGIVFAESAGASPDRQPNPRVTAITGDGEVNGKLVGLDADNCQVRLDEGVIVTVPRARISEIRVSSDKLVYLTDLKPKVEQTPAFDRVWPWLLNHGPQGDTIKMRGKPYRSGVVLLPRTRLTYSLDGGFDFMEAVIGMEDGAGERAHAVFRVLGDDKVLFDSGPVTPKTEPQAIRISVAGVNGLTLEADFGKSFDLGDLCVFALPRVLKN